MKHSEITFMDENTSQNKDIPGIFGPRRSAFMTITKKQFNDIGENAYFEVKSSALYPELDEYIADKKRKKRRNISKNEKTPKKGKREKRKEKRKWAERRRIYRERDRNLTICKL